MQITRAMTSPTPCLLRHQPQQVKFSRVRVCTHAQSHCLALPSGPGREGGRNKSRPLQRRSPDQLVQTRRLGNRAARRLLSRSTAGAHGTKATQASGEGSVTGGGAVLIDSLAAKRWERGSRRCSAAQSWRQKTRRQVCESRFIWGTPRGPASHFSVCLSGLLSGAGQVV